MTRDAAPPSPATETPKHDRPWHRRMWYALVRHLALVGFVATGGLRAGGRGNVPDYGPALLVSNHLSYLDVFVIGLPLRRPLNYVARSTLFFPLLGQFIRSVGGFPIQREGMGASGLKETLRRIRSGGIVVLFPEGTRSLDGNLGEIKAGIAVLAARSKVPIIPAGLAGTFEGWPRHRWFPRPCQIHIEYGPAIQPSDLSGLSADEVTRLIRDRLDACRQAAQRGLDHELSG